MLYLRRRASLAALVFLSACNDAPKSSAAARVPSGDPIARTAIPGTITRSPDARAEALLPAGDSVVDLAALPTAPGAALLVRGANGRARVTRWIAGDATQRQVVELPAGFEGRAIAAHPAAATYFVAGIREGRSQILAVAEDGSGVPRVVFESPRDVGVLTVGTRPFATDSGEAYRLFFAARLPNGGTSLRSVTERGRVEYQVVGPTSSAVVFPDDDPGGVTAPTGKPMSVHPSGEPLLWQDERGCTHRLRYDRGWSGDAVIAAIPCDGWTSMTPNGDAYLHWKAGNPGVSVIELAGGVSRQATGDMFLHAPKAVPDGRGVIGVVSKGDGRTAVAFVPLDMALADVVNAWQLERNACEAQLLAKEGGVFRATDSSMTQLYSVYDHYNYMDGPRVPFLATTDLFWENFGAAFNGVFILTEQRRAIPAFWSFVDSTNAALALTAPESKWANAFAAIQASRAADATGEAALIARATGSAVSTVSGKMFDFAELKPRGHYTKSVEMQQYFRAVHYLTEIGRKIDPAPLATLPENVHQAAAQWIDGYRPFIAAPRAKLVWSGTAVPLAPWAKHPRDTMSVFPLSWGLDNEILESTVYHDKWAPDDKIDGAPPLRLPRRLNPTGLDVASVYGNSLAQSLLASHVAAFPRLGPVLDEIRTRRPGITESSSVYERWLDALGSEWADSTRFPGAPPASGLWTAKRLQTGLASWATLREATILVNERAAAAEAGEGGFEALLLEAPRGYVEPAPQVFYAIAGLYESLARSVRATSGFEQELRDAIISRLDTSAAEVRRFAAMAERELRGQALSDADYAAIQSVAGSAEHQFLIYKSLGTADEGLPTPDPIAKIADVAGDPKLGILEVAVGNPLEWRQIVPHFGRRQIVVGGTYSYYEFLSKELYDNDKWRREMKNYGHPPWVQPYIASSGEAAKCGISASR